MTQTTKVRKDRQVSGEKTDADKPRTYKSNASAALHENMMDLYEGGIISKTRMDKFDQSCLTEITEFTPDSIRKLRLGEEVSQSVFARYLNVSKGLISQWERGEKKPGSAALKLLSLVKRNGIDAIA